MKVPPRAMFYGESLLYKVPRYLYLLSDDSPSGSYSYRGNDSAGSPVLVVQSKHSSEPVPYVLLVCQHVPDICTSNQKDQFICANTETFAVASVIWVSHCDLEVKRSQRASRV